MKKYILSIILSITPALSDCAEWIAVGSDSKESGVDTTQIEKELWIFLASYDDMEFEPKETYRFQYKKIDKEVIFINALCRPVKNEPDVGAFPQPTTEELTQDIYQVLDGGGCYFQIHYNTKNRKFSGLNVNGRA